MATDQDVAPDSSPGGQAPALSEGTGTLPVTESVSPEAGMDRPFHNFKSEMDRKFSDLRRQQDEVMALLSLLAAQLPQPRETVKPSPSSAELDLAVQAGDPAALVKYVDQTVDRRLQHAQVADSAQRFVVGQLQVLYGRYPVLATDPNHPLTRAALATRHSLMTQYGYEPGYATDLEAAKIAIADHPDIAASVMVRGPVGPRAGTERQEVLPTGQRGQKGRVPEPRKVSPKSLEIARRMGIADPAKAFERFDKRQSGRQSAVSQSVVSIVKDQEGS